MTITQTFTAPPTAPARTQDKATFNTNVENQLAWNGTHVTELTAWTTQANALEVAGTLGEVQATSVTSNSIGTGAKTFTIQAGKSFVAGMWVVLADTAAPDTNYMIGIITSYSSTTLVVTVSLTGGSGTKTAWTISQSAPIVSLPDRAILAAGVPTAAAQIDFLSVFTADYDYYVIHGTTLRPASDAQLKFRFANSGTLDSGTNYGSITGANSVNGTSGSLGGSTSGFIIGITVESSSALGCNFEMRIRNANSAAGMKSARIESESPNDSAGFSAQMAAVNYIGGAISGLSIFFDGVDFQAGGLIVIEGRRNS